jgi:restriction modification system specificity subunit
MNKKDSVAVVPKYRFPEFALDASIDYVAGGFLFDPITNRNHHADLPILAITQEYGAIPRDEIDYKVSVTEKSLKAYKIVEKGDFIISLRSFQGGIEYSMYDGICSPAYIILRKKTNIIDQYYKYYFKSYRFIQDLNKDLEGIRDGKMISYSQFSSILLPKPDKEEQQKIADCLSSIDDLISAEEKKLSLLNDYKKGWMQKLFPSEGKTVPEWRFPEFQDSEEWEKLNIKKACNPPYSGGTPVTSKKEYYNGDIPFIRSGEIGKEKTELFLTSEGLDNSSAKMIEKGDVLMALYGANSGDVAISPIKGAINQAILCLRHKNNNDFLYHYLEFKKNWIVRTYIQGGQGNLSGEIVKSIELCSPQEPEEQNRIAAFLSIIDELTNSQKEKIEALKQHKKALIQGLFPSIEEVL